MICIAIYTLESYETEGLDQVVVCGCF